MRRNLSGAMALALIAQLTLPAFAQDGDKAAQVARLRPQMKANSVASCIPEAKKSSKVTDAMATKFCTCVGGFMDEISDDQFLELARADLRKEKPTGDLDAKMTAKMESCFKTMTGG